jgi:hypothetical protein
VKELFRNTFFYPTFSFMKIQRYIWMLFAVLLILSAFQPKPKAKAKVKAKLKDTLVLSDKDYDIKFDKTFHDFGQVEEGEQVETNFILTNMGRAPVQIQNCSASGASTTVSFPKVPILPGKSGMIKVEFNTSGKLGFNTKIAEVTTNGGKQILSFRCEVIERKIKSEPIKIND